MPSPTFSCVPTGRVKSSIPFSGQILGKISRMHVEPFVLDLLDALGCKQAHLAMPRTRMRIFCQAMALFEHTLVDVVLLLALVSAYVDGDYLTFHIVSKRRRQKSICFVALRRVSLRRTARYACVRPGSELRAFGAFYLPQSNL